MSTLGELGGHVTCTISASAGPAPWLRAPRPHSASGSEHTPFHGCVSQIRRGGLCWGVSVLWPHPVTLSCTSLTRLQACLLEEPPSSFIRGAYVGPAPVHKRSVVCVGDSRPGRHAVQPDWPGRGHLTSRPVTNVVPWPPGGYFPGFLASSGRVLQCPGHVLLSWRPV